MTSRIYGTFDPRSVGPGLLLDSSLAIVTTKVDGTNVSRKVLGTLPKAVGEGSFECYIWSTSRTALAGRVSVGIATADSPIDKATGEDNKSWGYFPGTGVLQSNNATIATLPTAVERLCISVFLSATNGRAEWFVQGNYIGGLSVPTGSLYVPSVTVSGGTAGDIKAFLRTAPPLDFPKIIAG